MLAAVAVVSLAAVTLPVYRAFRLYRLTNGIESQLRLLIENGETIGETPAAEAMASEYLGGIFWDSPELLEKLKGVIKQGLEEQPDIGLGDVTAMLITYRKGANNEVQDVVVHAFGGFPAARRKPGFHRNGWFFQQIDQRLWNWGNVLIGFLGRDMVMFSANQESSEEHKRVIDALLTEGQITNLVTYLEQPLYYTVVFPDPRNIAPPELRAHLRAVVFKGYMAQQKGGFEALLLTPSSRSANYVASMLHDLRSASQVTVRTIWHGVIEDMPWGKWVETWWAVEMARNMEQSALETQQNLVRLKSSFERVMVNVWFKSMERLSRDLAQSRMSLDQRLDPRLVDARLATRKPLHYWSEAHRWGPDWPVAAPRRTGSTNAVPEEAVPAGVQSSAVSGAPLPAPEQPSVLQ